MSRKVFNFKINICYDTSYIKFTQESYKFYDSCLKNIYENL